MKNKKPLRDNSFSHIAHRVLNQKPREPNATECQTDLRSHLSLRESLSGASVSDIYTVMVAAQTENKKGTPATDHDPLFIGTHYQTSVIHTLTHTLFTDE